MLTFEWNALRPGDNVLVHDPSSAELALLPGVVVLVDAHRRTNSVGISVVDTGRAQIVLRPSSAAVHRDPRDETELCWRCQELA